MNDKISCNIVEDLMPLYIDGLTNEKTNEELRRHFSECKDCRLLMYDLREGEETFDQESSRKNEHNYLRKIKSRTITAIIVSILIVLLGSIVFFAIKPVYAEKLNSAFSDFLKSENKYLDYSQKDIRPEISSNVYLYTEDHLQFEVVEKITDGLNGFLTVKYTALDKEGVDWLKNVLDKRYADCRYENIGKPVFLTTESMDSNISEHGVLYTTLLEELDNLEDDTIRCYLLKIEHSDARYFFKEADIHFITLSNENCQAKLPVNDMEFSLYELKTDDSTISQYGIKLLAASDISFVLYGRDDNTLVKQVIIYYTSNGKEQFISELCSAANSVQPSEENGFCNRILARGVFSGDITDKSIISYDSKTITGVEIIYADEKCVHYSIE